MRSDRTRTSRNPYGAPLEVKIDDRPDRSMMGEQRRTINWHFPVDTFPKANATHLTTRPHRTKPQKTLHFKAARLHPLTFVAASFFRPRNSIRANDLDHVALVQSGVRLRPLVRYNNDPAGLVESRRERHRSVSEPRPTQGRESLTIRSHPSPKDHTFYPGSAQ